MLYSGSMALLPTVFSARFSSSSGSVCYPTNHSPVIVRLPINKALFQPLKYSLLRANRRHSAEICSAAIFPMIQFHRRHNKSVSLPDEPSIDVYKVLNDAPRALKLAHGTRTLTVTLANEEAGQNGQQSLEEYPLNMDDPTDQARLVQWMKQGQRRAIHSAEGSLEDVFIQVAGVQLV
jgi:hypothetical protein